MCGIAGLIMDASVVDLQARMRGMVAAMRRRGPDGSGVWTDSRIALGHARLSIIDLSENGAQPMIDSASGVVLVFNGEIYNYVELRRELVGLGHQFLSSSDTEVLLHVYLEWGRKGFNRCVGMWALAIYDPRSREVVLSRDRFGIKPLFYHLLNKGGLAFASTVGAVLANPDVPRRFNADTVRGFLLERSVDQGSESFFLGIARFPEASNAVIRICDSPSELRIEKYWNPVDHLQLGVRPLPFQAAVERFAGMLLDSVRIHSRSDVEVSSCLSGGLDSSVLVGAMAASDGAATKPKVFSAVFPGRRYDEKQYSHAVATRLGLDHHLVRPDGSSFLADIDEVVNGQEEPFGSTGVYVQWKVFQAIHRQGIKVAIDGQGADEYLGGYLSYLAPYALERLLRGRLFDAGASIAGILKSSCVNSNMFQNARGLLASLFGMGASRTHSVFSRFVSPGLASRPHSPSQGTSDLEGCSSRTKRAMIRYLQRDSLPALLRYEDRNSMHFSIESRVPFLDHRLVEFGISLPIEYLIDGATTKRVLRSGAARFAPSVVVDRRDKVGFGNPEGEWVELLISSGKFSEVIEETKSKDLVDTKEVRGLISGPERLSVDPNFLWRLFSVLAWHRRANQ